MAAALHQPSQTPAEAQTNGAGGLLRTPAPSSSSCYCRLLSPRILLLVSLASLSLLFTFILALRHGRPLHFPLALAAAPAPVLVGGGGYLGGPAAAAAAAVEEAVLGVGRGGSVAEGARPAVPGDLSVRGVGSATEGQETASGVGNGGAPSNGDVLKGQEVGEARNHSHRGLDLSLEVKEASPQGRDGEELLKDLISERLNLPEAKNLSKETLGPAAASAEKLEGTGSPRDVNFSIEASGPAVGARDEFLQGGHADDRRNSSVHGTYASQQGEHQESSNNSAVWYNPGAAPVNPDKQEKVNTDMDFARSNAVQCDPSDGSWLFDESYPLYESNSCPFIDEGFNCQANGRMDQSYMKMRWQPKHCNVPRFDARKMLEMLRGKRLVFVGDSINMNQWESIMCLLRTAILDPSRIHATRGHKSTKEKGYYNFKFLDYNCSVEYHMTHFLVHETKARIGRNTKRTVRIDTIDPSSSRWKGADVLVFNSAHWWSHHKTNAGVNFYQEGDHIHPHLEASTAFQRVLTTWASWIDHYINPRQTRVFFRSTSPSHFSGGEWNSGGHCRESTLGPNDSRIWPMPEINVMLKQVSKQMKTPVTILNITDLSRLRIDGHPSVYRRKGVDLTASSAQDCSHWCLPGVPDTWNELLFYHLMSSEGKDVTR